MCSPVELDEQPGRPRVANARRKEKSCRCARLPGPRKGRQTNQAEAGGEEHGSGQRCAGLFSCEPCEGMVTMVMVRSQTTA